MWEIVECSPLAFWQCTEAEGLCWRQRSSIFMKSWSDVIRKLSILIGLSKTNHKCPQSETRILLILKLGNELPQFSSWSKHVELAGCIKYLFEIPFSLKRSINFYLIGLDGITYSFQGLLCWYKVIAYFKVNTIWCLPLFSSISKSPKGWITPVVFTDPSQSFGNPFQNSIKNTSLRGKTLCSLILSHPDPSNFHVRLASSLNTQGSLTLPMAKIVNLSYMYP